MYLIIPKNDNQDLARWGFGRDFRNYVALRVPTGKYERKPVTSDEAGYNSLAEVSALCSVWLLDPRSRMDEKHSAIPTPLASAVQRIFVHFGGVNQDNMTVQWIQDSWQNTVASLDLPSAAFSEAVIMPISSQGGIEWQAELESFCVQFRSGSAFDLHHLENAWNKAWNHFHKVKPTREIVVGFFPFFVDACHFAALSDADFTLASADLKHAQDSLLGALGNLGSHNQIPEGFRQVIAVGQDNSHGAGNQTPTKSALNAFISCFREFAAQYTDVLLGPRSGSASSR